MHTNPDAQTVDASAHLRRSVCAWCQRVLRQSPEPVSHGICRECRERVLAEAEPLVEVEEEVDRG